MCKNIKCLLKVYSIFFVSILFSMPALAEIAARSQVYIINKSDIDLPSCTQVIKSTPQVTNKQGKNDNKAPIGQRSEFEYLLLDKVESYNHVVTCSANDGNQYNFALTWKGCDKDKDPNCMNGYRYICTSTFKPHDTTRMVNTTGAIYGCVFTLK